MLKKIIHLLSSLHSTNGTKLLKVLYKAKEQTLPKVKKEAVFLFIFNNEMFLLNFVGTSLVSLFIMNIQ